MRRAGRVSLFALFAVVAVVMFVVVILFSTQSPSAAGSEFMDALVRGDVNQLTDLSYVSNMPKDQLKKEWEFATQVAGKHYNFSWKITATSILPESGSVQMSITRNFGSPSAYPENFALPMIKTNGQWKVDVFNISRELYPALPPNNA